MSILRFDPCRLSGGASCIIVGRRNTGKSTLAKELLYRNRGIPHTVIYSITEEAAPVYTPHTTSRVLTTYETSVSNALLARQRTPTTVTNAALVLDDFVLEHPTFDPCLLRLLLNAAHYQTVLLLTCTHPHALPYDYWTRADYLFLLREPSGPNRRRLYEFCSTFFSSFELFSQIMDQCTTDYGCLVIDNTKRDSDEEERVFWFIADLHEGDWKIEVPPPRFIATDRDGYDV